MGSKSKDIAFLGLFAALALSLGRLEMLIPSPMPGIKLGTANCVVMAMLYIKGGKQAFSINIFRILGAGMLFSGMSGMIYALSGGVCSFFAVYMAKKINVFSIIGVSVIGGIFHNLGQLALACIVVENINLFYYAPVLIISGTITGIVIGFITRALIERFRFLKN